jgi:hypothetical protein
MTAKHKTQELWRAVCHSAEDHPPHLRVHRKAPWLPHKLGCGWRGPWRKRLATANADRDEHQKTHATKPPYVSTEGCCWPERHPREGCKQAETT